MDSESLPGRLQRYLLKQIPISQGLGISVTEASLDEILIAAPLAPNLNHHGTAFGGSVSAVAILSGWALVYARLEAEGQFPGVVIQYNEIRYLKPLQGVFAARAPSPSRRAKSEEAAAQATIFLLHGNTKEPRHFAVNGACSFSHV